MSNPLDSQHSQELLEISLGSRTHPAAGADRTAPDTAAGTTLRLLDRLFARRPLRSVAVRLWDGTCWPDNCPRAAAIVLNHPGALRKMLLAGTAKGLAEAYLRDDFDIEGDMESALEFAEALEERPAGWIASMLKYIGVLRLPRGDGARHGRRPAPDLSGGRHSISRDRRAVSFHYDVSNDFYRLWLDSQMVYSCAYFEDPGDQIERAQEAKMMHLCRKLRLNPGQRLLDIGCGWGGLALFAARRFGADVVGVTVSGQQARLAEERARDLGLAGTAVKIKVCDYRQIEESRQFDAIVSVGMSEHVGRERLPEYFRKAWRLLKPGGVFLNHAISQASGRNRFKGPSFIDAYVFPDSDIPPVSTVLAAAEGAGFEVRDVENLREHYMLTLRQWVRRLEGSHGRALEFTDERTYRVWRLYMAASAFGFDHGDLAIHQVLLSRPDPEGRSGLPLTRTDWYPNAARRAP